MQNRIRLLPLLALGVPMTSTIPLVVSCNKFEPEIITPTINTDENIICECSEIKLNHSFFITFEITNDDYIISAKSYVKIGNNKIEISELIDTYDTNQIVVSSDKVDDFNVSIYLITIMKGLNIDGGSQELHGLTSIANCDTKKWQTYFGD
ncbi:MAG: hypothetical protein MJ201_00975 [Mycoplasmoidaceae bacterium]|nr:hypothetical protein [Mycoplasmoidaceae bacterium]